MTLMSERNWFQGFAGHCEGYCLGSSGETCTHGRTHPEKTEIGLGRCALMAIMYNDNLTLNEKFRAIGALVEANNLDEQYGRSPDESLSLCVVRWNNDKHTTWEDIALGFKRAGLSHLIDDGDVR